MIGIGRTNRQARTVVSASPSGGEKRLYGGRHRWFILAVGIAFTILLARLWYIQVIRGDEYWRASTENIIRNVDKKPPRGRIYDRTGVVLAENRPSYDVYLVPHIFKRSGDDETIDLLQRYLDLSEDERKKVEKEAKSNAARVLVRTDVSRAEVALIESDRLRLSGVDVVATSHRNYPFHHVGAHTVGFVGEVRGSELEELAGYGYGPGDYIGRMGVEQAFEAVLRGSPGIERQVVDARGIPQGEAETKFLIGEYQKVTSVPGRDLHLTVDAELMLIIDRAFRNYPGGSAVAIDPRDGSVLAAYSKPAFNPNAWSGRLSSQEKLRTDNDFFKPLLDKSVSAYFPGSTFKVAGSLAALETGAMEIDDELKCHGSYRFGGRRFRCWKHGGHGKVNVEEALQQSCDVYYYKVADEIGIDPIAERAHIFGFGEPTGYPLNNESAGRVPNKEWHRKHSPEGYQRGFDLNTILGQGDTLATPLQVAMAYAAIANGEAIYYPRILDQVTSRDGETLFTFEPRVRKRFDIDPEHLQAIRHGLWMAANVENGTSYPHRFEGVEVAGKTGTAQVHKIGKIRRANRDKAIQLRDHAWYASYAPYENPEIVLVVFLQHGGHGGSDAAPVAMEILEKYFNHTRGETLERKVGEDVIE